MYIYCAVVLAILINLNGAEPHRYRKSFGGGLLKTEEVAKLIHRINEDNDAGEKAALRSAFSALQMKSQSKEIDIDYMGLRSTNEDPSLASIIGLIKNLKVGAHDPVADDDVRIHVIQNPDILQEYKEQLAKKQVTLDSSSSSSSDDTDLELILSKLLRRNAVFRAGKTEIHNNDVKPGTGGSNSKKNSLENDNNNDKKSKSHVTFKDTKNDDYTKDKKPFIDTSNRKKDSYKNDKKDDWDRVVQKFDKWENKNNDDFVKKTKYNNDKYKDDYSNKNDKYKNDNNRNDKYKDTNRDAKYNNDKRKDKYNDGYNDHRWNDNDSPKKKSVDDWDESKKTNSKKDDWDEPKKSFNSKKDDWDEPKKSFNSKKDDWDEPKKSLNSKKDSWDEPKKTFDIKKDDGWANWKSKSMEKVDKDRKKQNNDDWDKPIKKDSYERKKDDSFKDKPSYDIPAYKDTRDTGGWNKKPFVPKISEYYNPRPRIQEHGERPGFKPFGRTSIPFVGKKGIYEEEVVK